MNDNSLGQIISEFRNSRKMTQKELAKKLNVSDKAVSRWELGLSYPGMDMLLNISKLFKIPLSELVIARVSGSEDDRDIVKEVVRQYSDINKKIKIFLVSLIIIIVILTSVILFTNSYNRFKVYRVFIENENFSMARGFYIETKIKDTLNLNNLSIKGLDIKETDNISLDLYYKENNKEYILQSYSSLDNINFETYQSYIEIDDLSDHFDNLYIRLIVINKNGKTKEYNSKLEFTLDFSNNKIFYKEETLKVNNLSRIINEQEIIDILLKNGFKKQDEDTLIKKTKDKATIYYLIYSQKINYYLENKNFIYKYSYSLNRNLLQVKIFDRQTNTEIENYEYDAFNKKIILCITGRCNNYDEVLSVLDKEILKYINN